ncbi:hypothetical protein GMLC_08860 [Geomonas limicola]|uniref:Flagellar hook-length control protein-like C-terminal domain-containing protein n=1 Tax=Geomonas limicola TaxID=2740186 RepID=A0A6V8N666_9BACT|nr:flagellar hook-length control protein FliK [Geomonas limicola]GFO67307.1 hypothetical protein GMLC_08860 [Geomonas limicola]
MQMIANVVMPDVAPAVPQMVKGGAAAAADGTGSFAQLLQGSQQNRADAGQTADAQGGDAAAKGILLKLATAYGTTANAGGTQAADSQKTAEEQQTAALLSGTEALAQELEGALAGEATPAKGGTAGLDAALRAALRTGLAAQAHRQDAATVPQQIPANPTAAVLPAPLPAAGEAAEHQAVEPAADQQDQATGQDPASLTQAAQQQMAQALLAAMAQPATPVTAAQPDAPSATAKAAAAPEVAAAAAAPLHQEGNAPAEGSATQTQAAALVLPTLASSHEAPALQPAPPAAVAPAAVPAAVPVAETAQPVNKAGEPEKLTVVKEQAATDSTALDALRAAGPEVHPEVTQNAEPAGTTVPAKTGAPEQEPQLATASQRQAGAAAQTSSSSSQVTVQEVVPQAASAAEKATPADPKSARAAQAFHGTYSELRGAAERTATQQEAPVQEASVSGSAAPAARFTAFQGSPAGQDGFAENKQQGEAEQKAQVNQNAQAQLAGFTLKPESAGEAQVAAETKPTHLKDLHESILSQIKDGVVTHDGKGNGELSIRLNPGELGELKIQVRMEDNRVRVEVQADNKMVKDLLMSNLDSLKDSLTSKNFTMEGFDVSTGGGFNSPLQQQQGDAQQQRAWFKSARAGGYGGEAETTRVNYVTEEVNNLLDVRF